MDRTCGYIVLLELIAKASDEGGVIRSQVSPSDAAARFGISRAHVRKLLALGTAQAWLTSAGKGGQVNLNPATWHKLRRWIALELAWVQRLVA
jgi:hypothetical protein